MFDWFNNLINPTNNSTDLSASQTGATQSVASSVTPTSSISGTSPMGTTPTVAGGGTTNSGSTGFFSPNGGANLALGGIQVLGNLWNSYQAQQLAKEQMSFAREQFDTNLTNQTKTYNTALEDRIRGRYAQGTRSEEQLQSEIDDNSL